MVSFRCPLQIPVCVGIALALRRAGSPRRAVRTSLGRAPSEAGFRASAGCSLPRLRSLRACRATIRYRPPCVGITLALRRAGAPRRSVHGSLGRAPAGAKCRASAGCGLPRLRSLRDRRAGVISNPSTVSPATEILVPREINPFCTARLLDCQKILGTIIYKAVG